MQPTIALDTSNAHIALSTSLSYLVILHSKQTIYRCCTATSLIATAKSCSSPSTLLSGRKNSENFCPNPPKVSVSDINPSGPLESENVYVAEYLLSVSAAVEATVFFRQFQAGFTVTKK